MVLVGHESINRVILLHTLELPLSRYWHLAQAPCALNLIGGVDHGFFMRSVNDTCHLGAS